MQIHQLILASTSPFRQKLLQSTGLVFSSHEPLCDEKSIASADPETRAHERSQAKALSLAEKFPTSLIIGADQTLGWKGKILSKPDTVEAARTQLEQLAGSVHYLYSGWALVLSDAQGQGTVAHHEVVTCPMHMRALTATEIAAYLATGEWEGCVGSYRCEAQGIQLFHEIAGDSSAIVGLPLIPLLTVLHQLGVNGLKQPSPPWILL